MNADSQGVGQPTDEQVDLAVEVFRMLSDATRVRVLWHLRDQELPVHALAALVGKNPAAVSQHLAKLRMARLVRTRREGTSVFYRLENEHVRQVVQDALHHADHAEHLGGDDPPNHHRGERPDAEGKGIRGVVS